MYDDGTWKLKEGPYKETEISLDHTLFVGSNSNISCTERLIDVDVWINPKK
ncbi:MAG: hypothetical protein IPH49_04245 [Ignavibacteria bacterium]|nr:hypothetical protein [Ignavibacteria bacterium]